MKLFRLSLLAVLWIILWVSSTFASSFWSTTDTTSIPYCDGVTCSFERWVNLLKNGLNDVETGRKFSVYIQDVIVYLLTFVSIVGVIYIIYSGFQLMTGGGNEEKMKKTKSIITFVIIGIIIMWLAYPIMKWIITVFNNA